MYKNMYYKVTGGDALAFCIDYRNRKLAHRSAMLDYAESVGAEGFTHAWGYLNGLIFPDDTGAPKGLKQKRKATTDGRVRWTPHLRSVEGRAFKKAFEELGREPVGAEFTTHFGIPHSLDYRREGHGHGTMALYAYFGDTAFIGWTSESDDSFWVVLCDIDATIAEKVADGYVCEPATWTVPDGIDRSTKARYDLAVAAQKVADEEAGE